MPIVISCIDFDETLCNTDLLRLDINNAITSLFSPELSAQYEIAYEQTRSEGVISVPLVLQRLKTNGLLTTTELSRLAALFHEFPYQDYIYNGAEEALHHLKSFGKVTILSDGDQFFQPLKIYATTVSKLVDGVIIVPRKVEMFKHLEGFYPADTYVFLDDKAATLDRVKSYFGNSAKTAHIRQGRYATNDPEHTPDYTLLSIADVARTIQL